MITKESIKMEIPQSGMITSIIHQTEKDNNHNGYITFIRANDTKESIYKNFSIVHNF